MQSETGDSVEVNPRAPGRNALSGNLSDKALSGNVPVDSGVAVAGSDTLVFENQATEHYFPLRKAELLELLVARCEAGEPQDQFRRLGGLLDATFHHQFHACLEALKRAYAPFDPDADTCRTRELSAEQRERCAEELFTRLDQLLGQANYYRLSRNDIRRATEAASDWGVRLRVDFDIFDRLEVYARGDIQGTRIRRRLRDLNRPRQVTVPIYQRLVILFRLRKPPHPRQPIDTNTIHLKIFKNIPKVDLDMLLPGSRIRMSHLDHGKILLPTVTGVTLTLLKLIKGVALLATASLYGVLAFLGLVAGTLGYGVKSALGYLRTKDKYQLNLTRSLYYQNLDNNAGVLFRLLDDAEEQEVRETLLAYFLLWRHAPPTGWTERQLDTAAERLIQELTDLTVNFEVDDALAKLNRLGLAGVDDAGRWRSVPPAEGLRLLDRAWDRLFDETGVATHGECERTADEHR
jgi:hypothetical protein